MIDRLLERLRRSSRRMTERGEAERARIRRELARQKRTVADLDRELRLIARR